MILEIVTAVLGIAGTLTAYFFNPRRKLYKELDDLISKIEQEELVRDQALESHDDELLTVAAFELVRLKTRYREILQRSR